MTVMYCIFMVYLLYILTNKQDMGLKITASALNNYVSKYIFFTLVLAAVKNKKKTIVDDKR